MLKGQKRPKPGEAKTLQQIRTDYGNTRNGRLKRMFYDAKVRAKRRGIEFSLEFKDIVVPETCPVLGIPLVFNSGKPKDNSPTLDRVDITKGYTKDNVCCISYRANRIKNDATYDELLRVVRYMDIFIGVHNLDEVNNISL